MKLFNLNLFNINKDIVIASCILLLPFAFYFYNIVPETKIWKTSFFEIDSGKFDDANYYLWYLSIKFLTLSILSLWFLTNTMRWKNVLLISIITEIFKLFSIIQLTNSSIKFEGEPSQEAFCFLIIYLIALFLVSKKLNYYKSCNNSVTPLNKEINNQIMKLSKFDSKQYKSVKVELKKIETQRSNMDKKEYLTKLITLRDQLTFSN